MKLPCDFIRDSHAASSGKARILDSCMLCSSFGADNELAMLWNAVWVLWMKGSNRVMCACIC